MADPLGIKIGKSIQLLTQKQFDAIARAELKKGRKVWTKDSATQIKKDFKLKRSLSVIRDRLRVVYNKSKTIMGGVRDRFKVINAQFTYLAFPHKKKPIARKRRRSKRRVRSDRNEARFNRRNYSLEWVDYGSGKRETPDVFIARSNKEKGSHMLPYKRINQDDRKSSLTVLKMNAFNALYGNAKNFKKVTKNYSNFVMTNISKRLIKRAKKKLDNSKHRIVL